MPTHFSPKPSEPFHKVGLYEVAVCAIKALVLFSSSTSIPASFAVPGEYILLDI